MEIVTKSYLLSTSISRTSNIRPIRIRSGNPRNLKYRINDSSDSFSGNESGCDGEAVNVETLRIAFGPEIAG